MKTLCVIALARPLAAANRRFVTFGREARDHVGEWLGFRGHPMLARVNPRARVGHDADMAGEEDQVAPLELVASYVGFRSEEHTSELQSLMRLSYAVFCLNKTKTTNYTSSLSTLHLPPIYYDNQTHS